LENFEEPTNMGIADLQPVQIQANSLAAVDQPGVNVSSLGALPEFQDFMNAYKQGFITAEDIKKRNIVGTTGYEAEKEENIARKQGAQQAQIDLSEVRPLQRELAKTTTQGGIEQQTLANQLASTDPAIAIPAQEAFVKRNRQKEAILIFGTATPKLEKAEPQKPPEFDAWVTQQVNSYLPGANTPEADQARAVYETNLRMAGEKGEEYQHVVKAAKGQKRELTPGTPEYDKELRDVLSSKISHEKLQEIQFETLREFGKAQAKVAAEGAPAAEHVVKEFNPATGKEEEMVVRTDKRTGAILSKTVVGQQAPKLTEFQGKAASFAAQMSQSEGILDSLNQDKVDPQTGAKLDKFDPSSWTTTAQGFVPNRLRTEEAQLYNTAKKNWITAVLRQQSGAAIAKHEFDRYESQFFPQDGDTKSVIEQKKKLRDEQTKLMQLQAGPGGILPAGSSAPPTSAAPAAPRPTIEQKNSAPTFSSPDQIPNTVQFFKIKDDPSGDLRVNPNFRP
jgi:hypothetical protein